MLAEGVEAEMLACEAVGSEVLRLT